MTLTNDCCAFLLFFQLYKGYRADSCRQLHADMLSEATNVARARVFTADGDTPLKAAYRDGDAVSATRLHAADGFSTSLEGMDLSEAEKALVQEANKPAGADGGGR